MHFSSRSKMSVAFSLAALVVIVAGLLAMGALRGVTSSARAANASTAHSHIDCAAGAITCSEVWDSEAVFGPEKYIGHDEPSNLFYSNVPGSGNQMRYQLTLPKDPSSNNPTLAGKSFNFELHPAFWFGMAMCDTQSYPEQVSTCSPDSDTNIVDPAISPKHAGTALWRCNSILQVGCHGLRVTVVIRPSGVQLLTSTASQKIQSQVRSIMLPACLLPDLSM
jgi:hypothetical protein